MDRSQIEADYRVENGIIRSPGKFEGEPIYSPHFYEAVLNGDGEEIYPDDDGTNGEDHESYSDDPEPVSLGTKVEVSDEDRVLFPELAEVKSVRVYEREDGFVSVFIHEEGHG